MMAILIETEQPLFAHQTLNGVSLGKQDLQIDLVMLAYLVEKAIGLTMQTSCVQCKNANVLVELDCHVHQHNVFGSTEGKCDIVRLAKGMPQDLFRRLVLELLVQFKDVLFSQHGSPFSTWCNREAITGEK